MFNSAIQLVTRWKVTQIYNCYHLLFKTSCKQLFTMRAVVQILPACVHDKCQIQQQLLVLLDKNIIIHISPLYLSSIFCRCYCMQRMKWGHEQFQNGKLVIQRKPRHMALQILLKIQMANRILLTLLVIHPIRDILVIAVTQVLDLRELPIRQINRDPVIHPVVHLVIRPADHPATRLVDRPTTHPVDLLATLWVDHLVIHLEVVPVIRQDLDIRPVNRLVIHLVILVIRQNLHIQAEIAVLQDIQIILGILTARKLLDEPALTL